MKRSSWDKQFGKRYLSSISHWQYYIFFNFLKIFICERQKILGVKIISERNIHRDDVSSDLGLREMGRATSLTTSQYCEVEGRHKAEHSFCTRHAALRLDACTTTTTRGVTETNLHMHVKEMRREDEERLRSFLASLVSSYSRHVIFCEYSFSLSMKYDLLCLLPIG